MGLVNFLPLLAIVYIYSYTRAGLTAGARKLNLRGAVLAGLLGLSLTGLLIGLHPVQTNAATADTVNFQAKLLNSTGAIAPDGYYNVKFALYTASTGGTALWSEQYLNSASAGIRVANGYLTVNLGSQTPFPSTINWAQNLYVGMTVRGTGASCSFGSCTPTDGEMTPRLKLTAVPYAFSAGNLSNISSGGFTSTLNFQGATGGDQTFYIPDQGAAGSYSLLTQAVAAGNYVSLQGSTPGTAQTGNFNISGTGIASSLQSGQISISASSATTVGLTVKAAASQTADLLQFTDSAGNVNGSISAGGNILTLGRAATTGTVSQGKIVLADGTTDGYTLSLHTGVLTANSDVTIPNSGGNDTVCLYTLANCVGTGGGLAGSGTQNYISKFNTFGGNSLGNSSLYDNGSFLGLGTTTNSGLFSIVGSSTTQTGIFLQNATSASAASQVIKAATSQAGDLFQLQDNSGAVLSGFGTGGNLYYSNASHKLTVNAATLTADQTVTLPNESGTICLQNSANCGFVTAATLATGYIKLAPATAQSDTSANASIFINDSGGGNLAQLQSGGVNQFVVANNGATTIANGLTVQAGGVTATGDSTITGNLSVSGIVTATTALQAPLLQTAATTTASTNSADLSILTGNASGTTSNSGSINIDSGTATGTTGVVNIGTTNASAINIGKAGTTTTINSNVNQTGTATFATGTGAVSLRGNTTISTGKNLVFTAGAGTITQNFTAATGTAETKNIINSATTGTTTVNGLALNLSGSNNSTGTNTNTGINFGSVTAKTNNTFSGISFGTGYDTLLSYNGASILSGLGKLQNAGFDSSVNYSNLQNVTNLTASGNLVVQGTTQIALSASTGTTLVCQNSSNILSTCTNSYALGNGTAILLDPTSVQGDAGTGSSIFINKTSTGNLIQLQQGGADKFVIDNSGNATVAGTYNTNTFTGSNLTFGSTSAATIQSATNQALNLGAQGSGAINLQTNGNTRVTVLGALTGFGTTTPSAYVDIKGSFGGVVTNAGTSIAVESANQTANGSTPANSTNAGAAVVGIKQGTLSATNTNVTTTDATSLYIQGPTKAGTNQTLTNSYALQIDTASVAGGNGVQNAYGLSVQAPTGATNNYAAIFQGGGVGVGTAAPLAALHVVGTGNGTTASEILQGSAGQTADLLQFRNSSNTVLGGINISGQYYSGTGANITTLAFNAPSGSNTISFPTATGTVALTNDTTNFIRNQTIQQASSNFNISGIGIAGTALQAPLFQTADGIGVSSALTLRSGNSTTSGNTGTVTIASGNATSGNSGNIVIGVGTASGTAGTISIGTTNASGITIGRSSTITNLQGNIGINNATAGNPLSINPLANAASSYQLAIATGGNNNSGILIERTAGQTANSYGIVVATTTNTLLGAIDTQGRFISDNSSNGGGYFISQDQTTASKNTNDITLRSGNATGATSNSGNVIVDTGTATATAGTISIGTTSASGVTIGRSGITTTIAGLAAITGNATISGTLGVTGLTSLGGGLAVTSGSSDFTNSIATQKGSDYTTTGVLNNVNFGNVSLVRLTGTSTQTLTGIANGRDGYRLTIVNAASQAAIIKNNDTTDSSAANVIITGTGGDVSLPTGASFELIYDAGAGVWRTISGVAASGGAGVNTIGSLNGGTANANGASISGTSIYLQSASASFAGLVDTGAQTFAGAKTFSNLVTANSGLTTSGTVTIGGLSAGLVQSSAGGVLSSGAVDRNSSTFFSNSLSVANGGTGTNTLTANGLLYGNGTGAVQTTAAGTAGQLLLANASGVPTFTSLGGDIASVSNTGSVTVGGVRSQNFNFSSLTSGDVLQYNGTDIVNAKITNSNLTAGTFSSITGTGALSSGSIASGFGTIATTNNIGTSATVSAGTFDANSAGALTIGGSNATSISLTQTTNVAANKNIVFASGTGSFDQSASSGSFKTGTGAVSLNGSTSVTGSNTLTVGTGLTSLGGGLSVTNGATNLSGSLATKKGTDFSTTGISNNVSFGGTSLVRLTGASAQTITGIASGTDGYRLTIINAGTIAATIKNNDTTDSSAANVIFTGTGGDVSLPAGASLELIYDSGTNAWRVTSGVAATGGAGVNTVGTLNGGTANATGASISGTTIYLQSASATNAGLVDTNAQTFQGAKTFNSLITGNAGLSASGGAISLTGNAASSFTTTTGSLTFDAATALNLGNANATSVTVGRAGTTTTIQGNTAVTLSATTGGTLICLNTSSVLASCTNSYETTNGTDFIQNQNSTTQTANFKINGTGIANALQAGTFDTATAAALSIGTANASSVTIGKSGATTTVNGKFVLPAQTSATGFNLGGLVTTTCSPIISLCDLTLTSSGGQSIYLESGATSSTIALTGTSTTVSSGGGVAYPAFSVTQTSANATNAGILIKQGATPTSSADALQIQNSSGTVLGGFTSVGNLFFKNSGFTTTINTNTLTAARTISLPDASGTVALTNDATNFIRNQTGQQASSNFNISGTGIANILQAGSFDTAASGALAIGNTNASSVTITPATTFNNTATVNTNSATAFVVQGTSPALIVDTSTTRVTIGGNAGNCAGPAQGSLCVTKQISGSSGASVLVNSTQLINTTGAVTNYGNYIRQSDTSTAQANINYGLYIDSTSSTNTAAVSNGIFVNNKTGLGGGNLIQLQGGSSDVFKITNAGAATLTGSLTQTGGAVSLTANATSSFTTTAGTLTLDAATALNLGNSTATSVVIGNTANTTSITLNGNTSIAANKNITFAAGSGSFDQSAATTGTFKTGGGAVSLNGATSVTGSNTLTVGTGLTSLGGGLNVTNGATTLSGSLATKKGTDFSTTGSSDNVNFGNASLVRLTGASAQTIAGIANGADGYRLTIVNAASQAAVIKNNGSGTAANNIVTGTGGDVSLPAGASIEFIYDSGASVWRLTSGAAASGGAGVNTIGSLNGGTANANGATITGTTVYLQSASASFAGLVDTGTQTFAGAKTFSGALTANSGLTTSGTVTIGGLTAGLVQSSAGGVLSSGAVDRNSSSFFSNALSVANGGTGTNTLTANGLLYGNGTGAVQATAAGTGGQLLLANASGVPTFTTLGGDIASVGNTGSVTVGGVRGQNFSFTSLTSGDVLQYNGTNVVNAKITNSNLTAGTFSSITGVGALAAGSIASGFGTILTTNNIGTSATVSAGTFDANSAGALTIGGTNATSISLTQTTNVAANKSIVFASGTGSFDQSASSGTFKTGTGAVSLNGATTASNGVTVTNGGSLATQKNADFSTTGITNDAVLGSGSLVRLTGSSTQTINGIAGGVDGRILTIVNAATQAAIISNSNTGSASTNRITTGTGSDINLPAGATVSLIYDSGASLWRITSSVAGVGGYTSGVTTVGAVSGTATANGATITGNTLNLAVADASNAGLVSTSAQSFAGLKTFGGGITSTTINGTAGTNTALGNSTGTFSLTSQGGLNVTSGGALTGVASINSGGGNFQVTSGGAVTAAGLITGQTGLTVSGGAISLTGNAASSLTTTSGALTLDAATALNLGSSTATSIVIGNATNTTSISLNGNTNVASGKNFGINNSSAANPFAVNTLTTAQSGYQATISTNGSSNNGLVIQGVASQGSSTNYLSIQSSTGSNIFAVSGNNTTTAYGSLGLGSNSLTGSGFFKNYTVGTGGFTANDVVVLANDGGNGRAIDSTTAYDTRVLGVATNTVSSGLTGSVTIGGVATVNYTGTAPVIGDQLVVSSTSGAVKVDNNATQGILGYATTAGASGTVGVRIQITSGVTNPTFNGNVTVGGSLSVGGQTVFNTSGILQNSAFSSAVNYSNLQNVTTLAASGQISANAGLSVASGTTFANAGATVYTALALGNLDYSASANTGPIGTAAATVDTHTSFTIAETTVGQTFTLPNPTTTTAGRIIYIANTGTQTFIISNYGIGAGQGASYFWNGSAWVASANNSGVSTIGTLDSGTANANGASITGNLISLQSATASFAGLVNINSQTFAGTKTFAGQIIGQGGISTTGGAFSLQGSAASSLTTANAAASAAITLQTGNSTSGTAGTITIDTGTSSTGTSNIAIGTTNAGSVTIGKVGTTTTVGGPLTSTGLVTGNTGITTTGGAVSLTGNAASSLTTSAGALTLQGFSGVMLNSPSTLTGVASGTIAISTGSTTSANSGAITLLTGGVNGGVSGDITIMTGSPSLSRAGTVTIDTGVNGGSGTSTINIGNANATNIVVGNINASGVISLNSSTTLAAGKSFTFASGAGNFDQTSSTGTFKTGSGAVSLQGNTTVTGSNTFTVNGGLTTLSGGLTVTNGATLNTTITSTNSFAANNSGFAQAVTNTNTSATVATTNAHSINLTGTANTNANANVLNGILFGSVAGASNNAFYGLNFGTGYNDLLRYNNQTIIGGNGILNNFALSGTYNNSLSFSNTANTYNGASINIASTSGVAATITGASTGNILEIKANGGATKVSFDASGNQSTSANIAITGTGTFDQSASSGTFKTGTGAVSLQGSTTVATGKTLTVTDALTTLGGGLAVTNGSSDFTGSIATKKGADFATNGISNDVNFGNVSLVRLTGTAAQTINGITGGRDGYLLTIINAGSNSATIANSNSGSANGNRITTGTGGDITLTVGSSIQLVYDATGTAATSFWRAAGSAAVTGGSGVNTVGPVSATPTTNGATITGNTLNLAVANGTNAGLVSTTTQTFGGDKTFSGLITGNAGLIASGGAVSLTGAAASSLTTTAGALTLQGAGGVGISTTNVAGGSSAITLQTGNATAGTAGSITIDTGTSSTGTSNIAIGGTNAGSVTIGRSGIVTTVAGTASFTGVLGVNNASGANSFAVNTLTTAQSGYQAAISTGGTSNGGLVIQGVAGQSITAPLLSVQASNGGSILKVTSDGYVQAGTGSFVVSAIGNGYYKTYSIGTGGVTANDVVVLANDSGNGRAVDSTTAYDTRVLGVASSTAVSGGAIAVGIAGTATVNYTGTAPVIGDQLVVSNVSGAVKVDNNATQGILGYATTAGASGTVGVRIQITSGQTNPAFNGNVTVGGTLQAANNTFQVSSTGVVTATLSTTAGSTLVCQNASSQLSTCSNSYALTTDNTNFIRNQTSQQGGTNFNISGTGIAATSLQAPLFQTADVSSASTNSSALTLRSGNSTVSGNTGNISIVSGDANSGTAGSITIDNGAFSTGSGIIAIATSNRAHTVSVATGNGNQTVAVGSTSGTSSLALNAGTGGLSIQTQGTGILGVGNNGVAQTIQVGNTTGTTSLALSAGSGGINLSGNTSVANGSTFSVGNSLASFGGGISISGGNFDASGSSGTFKTTTGAVSLQGATSITGANTLTVGTGLASFGGGVSITAGNSDFTTSIATKRGTDYSTTGSADASFANASLVRLTGASTQTITGIANGRDGYVLTIVNAAGQSAVIKNSGSGTPANNVVTGTAGDVSVPAGASLTLVYDAGANVWRITSGVAAAGGAGVNTIGALNGGTANATGATITATTLYLQSASASFAGLVDTGAQTFAGAKTFSNTTTSSTVSVTSSANPTAGNALILANNTNASATGNLLALQNNGTSKFTVDANGNVVALGTYNGNTFTSSALTFSAAGAASIKAATGQDLNIDGGSTGTNLNIGNSTGTINVGGTNVAHTINIGAAGTSTTQAVAIGSNTSASSNTLNGITTINGISAGSSTGLTVNSNAASNVGLLVQGTSSQSADLVDVKISGVTNPVFSVTGLSGTSGIASGATILRNSADGMGAFQIQNALGSNIVSVNTNVGTTVVLGHQGTGSQGYVGNAISSATSVTATSRSFSFTKSVATGHTLLGTAVLLTASLPSLTITDTQGNSYSVDAITTTTNNKVTTATFSGLITTALTTADTLTITSSVSSTRWAVDSEEFDTILTTGAKDQQSSNSSDGGSTTSTSNSTLATTSSNEVVFGSIGLSNATRSFVANNTYTTSARIANANQVAYSGWKFVSATGTQAFTGTINSSTPYSSNVVTYKSSLPDNGASGSIAFNDGTTLGYTATLKFNGGLSDNRVIYLPDASGTICLDSGNCSAAGGYIVNGTSLQTGNFNLSGTGYAPHFDAASAAGSLGLGDVNAGTITVGNATNTTSISLTASTSISIGSTTAGSTFLQSAGGTTVLSTTNPGTILTVNNNATTPSGNLLALQNKGTAKFTVDVNGNVIVGNTAGTGGITNNGSTVNTVNTTITNFASNGTLAQTAVDNYTYDAIPQTTASITITLPAPTANTTYGRLLYVTNTGTNAFNFGNTYLSASLKPGATATLVWANVNGAGNWTYAGSDGGGILNQTTQQTGANFNIDGTGTATSFRVTPGTGLFDTSTAGLLNIGTGTATSVALGGSSVNSIKIQSNGGTTIQATTDNAGAFSTQNSVGATIFSVDTSNTAASSSANLSVNGGSESTYAGEWTAFGTGSTAARDTNSGEFLSGNAALKVTTTTGAASGATNNLGAALSTGTTYVVSFSAKLATGGTPAAFTDLDVRYNRTGTTQDALCSTGSAATSGSSTFSSRTITTTAWTKVTCSFVTSGTAGTGTANVAIIQTAAATSRTFYIDNFDVVQQNSTGTQNTALVRIGGPASQGLTLFQLDTYAGVPFTGANSALAGAMYFDTTSGKMQCYDGSAWGACGAAPNSNVTLTPEYTGAVLNGTGIGTMTSDFCGNNGGTLAINTSLCASGEARNFYKWTSPQGSSQGYSVYVTYKLPSTFKSFVNGSTSLTARTDSATNAGVTYNIYKSTGSAITTCSTGTSSSIGLNTWTPLAPTTDPSTGGNCAYSANNYIIFQITASSLSNANAYIENLNFNFTNQ